MYTCVCVGTHTQCTQVYSGTPLSHKKDTVMPSAATWTNLEILTREVRQMPHDIIYM